MEPQEDKTFISFSEHIDPMGRFLVEVQKLLAQRDNRRSRERGEDGCDG
jgi:hypothetical protein